MNKIEYLVKYSVAPPPSRDYYGLKVFQDEVILYLWRISHGPHKAPIIHRAKLIKFGQEKSLQGEIRHGFGKYLLQYVNNIAEGNRNTLLTLPKSIIGKISRYLKFTDIIKLSSLSHVAYEVFNTDLVWQILYTRDKKANISLKEREVITVYGWKQLYKTKHMQAIKEQKKLRTPNSSITNAKTNKLLMKPISDAPKSLSNKASTINIMTKKHLESSDLITIPPTIFSKTMSDTRFRTCTKNEKSLLQKKDVKNTTSTFNMHEKNVKKDIIMSKTITGKQETGSVSKRNEIFNKQVNQMTKLEKYSNKINNINTKSTTSTQGSKLKSKTQSASKTFLSKNVGNIKSSPVLTQNLHSKTPSKIKSKPKKKMIETKSEILNTEKALSENPFVVVDDRIDLADLIEASLKNIKSPRSIFDYDFSCVQKPNRTRDILDIRNEIQNTDKLKELKPTGSNVTNNFSNKVIRGDGILEKLSEKGESFSEASDESFVKDKKTLSRGDGKSFLLSEKYMKAREELLNSLDLRRSDPISSQHQWDPYPDISFQSKSFTSPRKVDEKSPIPTRSLKPPFLKSYASHALESRKEKSSKDFF